jgi:hypothetical protein
MGLTFAFSPLALAPYTLQPRCSLLRTCKIYFLHCYLAWGTLALDMEVVMHFLGKLLFYLVCVCRQQWFQVLIW